MRKVTVSRPQKIQFPFTKGKIIVGDKECAQVKAGKTETFEIPDGRQDIQVKFSSIPPTESNVITIDESDGDLNFEIKIKVSMNNDPTTAELTKK